MSRRLDGRNLLAYMGVKPSTPTQMVVNKDRRPTSTDLQNFQLGTWWIIPTRGSTPSNEVWILINKTASAATWIEVDSGGGAVVPGAQYTLLTADGSGAYGPNVGPGTAGQVLVSDGGISNPAFITPTAGSGLTVTANASTLLYELDGPFDVADGGTGVTNLTIHNLLVGNNTAAVTLVAPHATTGIPLISNGAGSTPGYGKAIVAGGGTGVTTMTTAYAPVCAGTTATGALQVASTGMSNAGYVLTSTGSSSLPEWKLETGVVSVINQVKTSSGTYTPTPGMRYCTVELVAGGGGGGGIGATASVDPKAGAGGGSGGYTKITLSAATVGASQSFTIGAAGVGVSGESGTSGGSSTFGAILTATGGAGGGAGLSVAQYFARGGAGGSATGGDIVVVGQYGSGAIMQKITSPTLRLSFPGRGGDTPLGLGGVPQTPHNSGPPFAGRNGTGYGSGGSGAAVIASTSASIGGDGMPGVCIITEYL